jgi:hypothetical protein
VKKTAIVPDHAAIYRDIYDANSRPYMPRTMTLLNTTRVQGKPSKGTTNTTLGMYSSGPSAEIQMLDIWAHAQDGGYLRGPRLIKKQM